MISGFDTFNIYVALKLHFDKDTYDVFKNNGAVKTSIENFSKRNDRLLFEKLGKRFDHKQHLVQCIVANIAYGNPQPVYDIEKTMYNYIIWRKRKDSITNFFEEDLKKLSSLTPSVIYTANITIESKVILNEITNFIDFIPVNALTTDRIRLIRKMKKFVKFDEERINKAIKTKFQNNYI